MCSLHDIFLNYLIFKFQGLQEYSSETLKVHFLTFKQYAVMITALCMAPAIINVLRLTVTSAYGIAACTYASNSWNWNLFRSARNLWLEEIDFELLFHVIDLKSHRFGCSNKYDVENSFI